MVTVSDYRLAVTRVQTRANNLERDLYITPALEIRALVADIQEEYGAVRLSCPIHNMTRAYREIMQDVAAGLANMDRAACAAIDWQQQYIR